MSLRAALRWVVGYKWELCFIAALTVLAAILRIYRIADLPHGLHGDEALTGLDALRVLDEGWIGSYVGSALGQPTGPLYWTALIFKMLQPSLLAVRLAMAIPAILTVPVSYLFFRIGFGRGIAIIGTIALTFSFWHIHFSRIGFMVITMPMVIAIGSVLALWMLRSTKKRTWFFSGLIVGLGIYSYGGYIGFLVMFGAFLFVQFVLFRSRWRILLPRYGLLTLGIALAVFPLASFVVSEPNNYFHHVDQIAFYNNPEFTNAQGFIGKLMYMVDRAWNGLTLLIYNSSIDYSDATGGRGALNPILALFSYSGLIIAFTRWRRPPYLLSGLMVMGALCTTVFTADGWGEMRRSLIAIPFVYALAGVAIWEFARLGSHVLRRQINPILPVVGGCILMVTSVWNIYYYFGEFVADENTKWTFASRLVDSLDAAHTFQDPGKIYFYSARWSYNYETRRFLYPDTIGVDRSREFGTFSLTRTGSGPVTYVLLPPYQHEFPALEKKYPGGIEVKELDRENRLGYVVYHLP